MIITHSRQEVLAQTISQNQQTAEVIRRSIRYAMLQNHREQVAQIIEAVSRTRGIEKIRIFDKEGEIITSTLPSEIGTRVDKAAEACFHCHSADRPLQQLPGNGRATASTARTSGTGSSAPSTSSATSRPARPRTATRTRSR